MQRERHSMRVMLMAASICACGLRPVAAAFGDKEGVVKRLRDAPNGEGEPSTAAPIASTSGACIEPSNFYTFEASPHCLARACGDLQNRPPCMALLRSQLAAVRKAGTPRCAQGTEGLKRLHVYWDGPLLRSTRLSLMSIGVSQTCARLTVWYGESGNPSAKLATDANDDGMTSPLQRMVARGILEFRYFDLALLSQNTIYSQWASVFLNSGGSRGKPKVGFSDFVRLFVLYLFGGIYVDADVVALHDLWPLQGREFAYRWGLHNGYNTAVMGLRQQSAMAEKLSLAAIRDGKTPASFHPLKLRSYCTKGKFQCLDMLPSIVFDPLWLHQMNEDNSMSYPFKQYKHFQKPPGWRLTHFNATNVKQHFFNGALTYHWHNHWKVRPVPGSAFLALEDYLLSKLAKTDTSQSVVGHPQLAVPRPGLLAVPIGGKSAKLVSSMVEKFVHSTCFDVLLFPYDTHGWTHYSWARSPRVRFIRRPSRAYKWLLAKDYLTPALVHEYSHVFVWDDDMDVDNFDPCAYLAFVQRLKAKVSQPALQPVQTCHKRRCGECASAWCGFVQQRRKCDYHYAKIIEVMVPVYEAQTWANCVWPKLAPEATDPSGTGWGIDWSVHINCGCRAMWVIDKWTVAHRDLKTLRAANGMKSGDQVKQWYLKNNAPSCTDHADTELWGMAFQPDPNISPDKCLIAA